MNVKCPQGFKSAALAVIVTTLFAGCGGGQPGSTSTEIAGAAASASAASASGTPVVSGGPAPAISATDAVVRRMPGADLSAAADASSTASPQAAGDTTSIAYVLNVDTRLGVQSVSVIRSSDTDADTLTAATRGADGKFRVLLPTDASAAAMTFIRVTLDDGNAVEMSVGMARN